MRIRIKNGFDIPLAGRLQDTDVTVEETRRVGLVGADYKALRPSLTVEQGDRIRCGETVFHDRRFPQMRVTSPCSGTVRNINWGPQRQLESIVIDVNDDPPIEFDGIPKTGLRHLASEVVRDRLLESGQWVSFRARPFEGIARPDLEPRAVFITAIDTNPMAPDPLTAISANADDFQNGVTVVARLTSGPIYVCTAADRVLPLPELPNVAQVEFSGPHPAGLPGTHINALERVSDVPDLWHIGYQDVIAIGRLFTHGFVVPFRDVVVAGPGARAPRILRVRVGAELAELAQQEDSPECRLISGSILSGRQTPGYLGRYHNQITVLPEVHKTAGSIGKIARMIWRGNAGLDRASSCAVHGRPGGMLALEDFDRIWPYRIPPAALLRSLLIGDIDAAIELGCLGLAEDDLALCSYVCAAKYDYGSALRRTLHEIERLDS